MVGKHIFFDYGGLLFDCRITSETRDKAHGYGADLLQVEKKSLANAFDEVRMLYEQNRAQTYEEWSLESIFEKTLEKLDLNCNKVIIPRLVALYEQYDHVSIPFPDTLVFISKLAEKFNLSIVTDCPHQSLYLDLRQYDLLKCFKHITFSNEAGWRKPHPAIYSKALSKAFVPSNRVLFVSHSELDLQGAKEMGMQALLVNRDEGEILKKLVEAVR